MNNKNLTFVLMSLLLMILLIVGCQKSNYDSFALCLTQSNVKFYGAFWCTHCENMKKEFGDSMKYVNYIECSLPDKSGQTDVCKEAGIMSYPTWEFKNGTRIEGELTFFKLSQSSGCKLEAN